MGKPPARAAVLKVIRLEPILFAIPVNWTSQAAFFEMWASL